MLWGVVFWGAMALAVTGWALVEVLNARNSRFKLIGFGLMVLAIVLFFLSADKF